MRQIIKATDKTIDAIVKQEIEKYGKEADLNHIDVSEVTNMSWVFYRSDFNGDISKWDVSNVKHMYAMFEASLFRGDISSWDVSNVIYMSYMFSRSYFNGDISNWDVSNVKHATGMFQCSAFNGYIYNWDLHCDETDYLTMFSGCCIPDEYKPAVAVCYKRPGFRDALIELLERLSASEDIDDISLDVKTPDDVQTLNNVLNFLRENI